MNNTASSPGRQVALDAAHELVDLGVPVFTAQLDKAGNPRPPKGWEKTEPDHARVKWRPGLALCAVMGTAFDALDVDPRNGGTESLAALKDELAGGCGYTAGRPHHRAASTCG